ncbi:MAG: TonB-dependent receptor [Hyphomonadaceae bacterium]|nr:TonB-dependent receptor [Hyphomonadaceae bacterium]
MSGKRMWLYAASAVSALAAGPAFAQESSERGDGVGEIVVTAERRVANIQETPLAVSAFTPQQLEAAQLDDTVDLVRFTPSVTGGLNTGTGAALSFFIRGLGSTEQIATFDVPVATYVDEVYFARQNVNAVSLFDVERVEVLRGPQGTLFGRNTTGGAVSITLRKPAEEFGFFVEGSYGSFERQTLRGSIDIPLSSSILTKVSGFYVDDEGYGRSATTGEDLNGEESYGGRIAVRLQPSDAFTWDIAADYVDQQKTTIGGAMFDPRYTSRSGLRTTECDGDITDVYLRQARGNCAGIVSGGVTSNLAVDFLGGELSFITAYRSTDQDFALDFFNGTGARGGYVIVNEVRNQQFTQELKYVGTFGAVDLVAGLFYLDEQNKTEEIDYFGALLADWVMYNETQSYAAYAQGDIHLNDAWTLTLGGRFTQEEKALSYADAVLSSYPTGVVVALPAANLRPTNANIRALNVPLDQDEEKFTPRVALSYQIDDDRLIYASATNGFKSGGWNTRVTRAAAVTAFGPEESWSYELGARTDWMGGRLRLNPTIYYQEVKDLQLLSGTGDGQFLTRNAADLEAYGFELEIAARPIPELDVFGSFSLAERDYQNIPPRFGAGGVSCNATPEPANCTTTRDEPVRYPTIQGTFGASYYFPLEGLGELTLNTSLSYSGYYWTSTYNDTPNSTGTPLGESFPIIVPLSKVRPTTLLNLGAVFRSEDQRWLAALECSNCTEEYYATSSLFGFGYWNDPRRVTFRLRYTY